MTDKTDFLYENVGYTIRLWRLANGYSVEDFSRQTGIPVETIVMIETSQTTVNLDQVFRMSAVLDIDPSELMLSIGKPSTEARVRLLALSVESHPDPEVRRYVEDLINTALLSAEQDAMATKTAATKKIATKKIGRKKSGGKDAVTKKSDLD